MEDILDLYQTPYAPQVPMLCMEAQPVQLLKEGRQALPAAAGQLERDASADERTGTANIFLCTAPLRDVRFVNVREHETAMDWALELPPLLETQ